MYIVCVCEKAVGFSGNKLSQALWWVVFGRRPFDHQGLSIGGVNVWANELFNLKLLTTMNIVPFINFMFFHAWQRGEQTKRAALILKFIHHELFFAIRAAHGPVKK